MYNNYTEFMYSYVHKEMDYKLSNQINNTLLHNYYYYYYYCTPNCL